jgi:alpha-L-rhamnosidase
MNVKFEEAKPVWFQGLDLSDSESAFGISPESAAIDNFTESKIASATRGSKKRPVGEWQKEKNIHAGFRAVFKMVGNAPVGLRVTGSTLYRVFLNGGFVQHGPARGPHGFYRVDELDLTDRVVEGDNLLAIEVVGVNCNSFAYLNQPSFLQAELMVDGAVIVATGGPGFEALRLPERIQKVERYSFQRPCVEAYCLAPGWDDWRTRGDVAIEPVSCAVQEEKKLLARGVALSDFQTLVATKPGEGGLETQSVISSGTIAYAEKPVDRSGYWWMNDPRYVTLESFAPEEFERDLLQIYQACDGSGGTDGRWEILDLGTNLSGFVQLEVSCAQPVRLLVVFDELLIDGDIDLDRNKAINFVYYELQPGGYSLESIEPYTFRYLKIMVLDGGAEIQSAGIREYANAEAVFQFNSSDPDLLKLFEAGRQTFRQNATDLYMDCPGRERAGWLCDSFFTGRAEKLLCGNSKVERNFLENYLLPESFGDVPQGMLPMCYPSEHPGGRHIPQWVMWLVLELEEYLDRTGDRAMIDRFEPKIDGFLNYLKPFENSDGLLEKLPSWNFIEWSKANELTDDVNYPTNMLYARALETAARLYGRSDLSVKAASIHQTVRDQSFNGTFFVDNSVRDENGILIPSGECTEVCQYYAFFCGTAEPSVDAGLWAYLLEHAGPNRTETCLLHPANAFIGYYLRMDLLSRFGEGNCLLDEMKRYFLGMTERTGTLWERDDEQSSCNHGFASYLCVLLARHAAEAVAGR